MTGASPSFTGSRAPRQHDLKTWPEFFADLLAGDKPFELRKNDRDFQVGDELRLHEYDPATTEYSGRVAIRVVTYMLGHRPDAGCAATFGLQPGHVIMGIRDVAQAKPEPIDYSAELLRWSNIEIALRKKFPTLATTGVEIDTWPELIGMLDLAYASRRYIVRKEDSRHLSGMQAWGECWSVIDAPEGPDAVTAQWVGFFIDQTAAETVARTLSTPSTGGGPAA